MEAGRIPNRLRRYRRIAGYSQREVARFIGLTATGPIYKWEKGTAMPSVFQLFKLSYLYGTLPNHLYPELAQLIKQEVNNALAATIEHSSLYKSNNDSIAV